MTSTRKTIAPGSLGTYPVLPLRDIVVFPHMIVPLFVGREKSIRALEEVMKADKPILLATQMNAADDDPATDAIFSTGTLAKVLQLLKLPDGTVKVLVEGDSRARIKAYLPTEGYYEAEAEAVADDPIDPIEAEALSRSVVSEFENYVKLNKKISPEVVAAVTQIEDYGKLADTIASHLAVKLADKQAILEIHSIAKRFEKCLGLMESEISVLQVEKRIRTRVKRQMEKTQREYYLNEQMKAIQKELGDEDGKDEMSELEDRIKKTKLTQGSARQGARRGQEAAADVADVRRGDGGAQLSRLAAVDPVAEEVEDQEGPARRAGDPRRRSFRPRQGQGTHRRVSGGAAARQQADRADPLPRRPARRRQDLARQVDRQGDGARIRAHVARRRARRSGDPRPSAHLHRLDARQGHPVDAQGEDLQPALPARRDRQDGDGFPRRSVVGAARGARSRAERCVQRPLPRGRLRSVERDVRDHRQHAQHPAGADGPHGDHPHRRLHRGREGRNRQAAPVAQFDGQARPRREGMGGRGQRPDGARAPLHARGGGAQPRARDLQSRAQGGQGHPHQQEEEDRRLRGERRRISRPAEDIATARSRRTIRSAW